MIKILLHCILLLLPWIVSAQIPDVNNPELHPKMTNQTTIDSIKGQPISYYMENSHIDQYSKLFYQGKFAVSDDNLTLAILDSLDSDNASTRPFYFYINDQIIKVTNGTLSGFSGFFILEYLTAYPCEFFELSNELNAKTDLWIYLAAYDIYFDNKPSESQKRTAGVINDLVKSGCPEFMQNADSLNERINQILTENHE